MSGTLTSPLELLLQNKLLTYNNQPLLTQAEVSSVLQVINQDPALANELDYLYSERVSIQVVPIPDGADAYAFFQPGSGNGTIVLGISSAQQFPSDQSYFLGSLAHEGGHAIDDIQGTDAAYFQGTDDPVQFTSNELASETEAAVANAFASNADGAVGFTVIQQKTFTTSINGTQVVVNGDAQLQQYILDGIPGICGGATISYDQNGVPSVTIPDSLRQLVEGAFAVDALASSPSGPPYYNYATTQAKAGGEIALLTALGVDPSSITGFADLGGQNGSDTQVWRTSTSTVEIIDDGQGGVQFEIDPSCDLCCASATRRDFGLDEGTYSPPGSCSARSYCVTLHDS